jgi:proton glutamate symport protein
MESKQNRKKNTIILFILSMAVFIALYLIPGESLSPVPPPLIQIIRVFFLFFALFLICERLISIQIYNKIMVGLILGVVAGIVFQNQMAEVQPVGTAFIRLIRMVIIPLVFASLLIGTASMDPKKMGRIGLKTLSYYLIYTAFAIFVGLVLANVFKPGSGLPDQVRDQLLQNYSADGARVSGLAEQANPIETLLNIIPTNLFEGLSTGTILQIIFFAIFSGVALALIPKNKSGPVLSFFDGINDTMIKIVHIAIKLAPYGVFALIAAVIGSFGTDILLTLLKYTIITISGMIILNFTYPIVVMFFSGMSPLRFMKEIRSPQMIAFSTSSSSATLPVTIETCEERLGVPRDIASFVLPLGATVNMNGTALYHGVSAVFIAQVFGIPLGIGDQLMIVLTATLAAIGCAGAPMAGILMLVIVLEQVGIPTEGIALIFGVERILDMFRTAINITGDASAAVIIAATEGELNPPSTENIDTI